MTFSTTTLLLKGWRSKLGFGSSVPHARKGVCHANLKNHVWVQGEYPIIAIKASILRCVETALTVELATSWVEA